MEEASQPPTAKNDILQPSTVFRQMDKWLVASFLVVRIDGYGATADLFFALMA